MGEAGRRPENYKAAQLMTLDCSFDDCISETPKKILRFTTLNENVTMMHRLSKIQVLLGANIWIKVYEICQ